MKAQVSRAKRHIIPIPCSGVMAGDSGLSSVSDKVPNLITICFRFIAVLSLIDEPIIAKPHISQAREKEGKPGQILKFCCQNRGGFPETGTINNPIHI